MSLQKVISSLKNHAKRFPEEKISTDRIIDFLMKNKEKAFHNFHWDDGHITASMLITNTERTKVLLMFHKKLQKWLQFGGHSDDSPDVLATAIREFHEESGVTIEPTVFSYHDESFFPIFDVDIHEISADLKGRPLHFHYDIRFLGTIPDTVQLQMETSEVDDIRWFDIEGVEKYIEEGGVLRMIEKIKNIKNA